MAVRNIPYHIKAIWTSRIRDQIGLASISGIDSWHFERFLGLAAFQLPASGHGSGFSVSRFGAHLSWAPGRSPGYVAVRGFGHVLARCRTAFRHCTAVPAALAGAWPAQRQLGTVDRASRRWSAASSSSVPLLRILRMNCRPLSIRRPAWTRSTRRIRFQDDRAKSSSRVRHAVRTCRLNATRAASHQAAFAPKRPLGMVPPARLFLRASWARSESPQRPLRSFRTACAAIGFGPSPSLRPSPGAGMIDHQHADGMGRLAAVRHR